MCWPFAPRCSLSASPQADYDAANQQIQLNGATPNQTFDANGNLTTSTDASGTTTYTWDARNRLVGITGPGLSASYQYDALGRRISNTLSTQSSALSTSYLYDGNDIVQEIGGSAVGASYVRSLSIDEPFIRQIAGGNEFYHVDALGSTLALTNQSGAVQSSYQYEAFGKTTIAGTSSNPFHYTGRENDGTGLYYYRYRYYVPPRSRFSSEDPVEYLGGDINLYSYVMNMPTGRIDPSGLSAKCPDCVDACLQDNYGDYAELAYKASIWNLEATAVSLLIKGGIVGVIQGGSTLLSGAQANQAAQTLSTPASRFSRYFGYQVRAPQASAALSLSSRLASM